MIFLVGILPAAKLDAEMRAVLATAGFREGATLSYETVWSGTNDLAAPRLDRIIFQYEAVDAERAESDARAIVGPDFSIRVYAGFRP